MRAKTILKPLVAAGLMLAGISATQAVPSTIQFINSAGTPTFSESGGVFSLDFSSAALNIVVSHRTGAFTPIPLGTSADWANGFDTTSSGFQMWEIQLSGVNFRLDGSSITLVSPGPGALNLEGEGVVHVNAFNAPATWTLGINTAGGLSVFGASTTTDLPADVGRVPDAGMTLPLLALGVSGLLLIRKKK